MDRHWIFYFLRLGKELAAPLPCDAPDCVAFVGVYPLDLERENSRTFLRNNGFDIVPLSGWAYHTRTFEVDRSLLDAGRHLQEGDLKNSRSSFAFDDATLAKQIEALGIAIDMLERPFRCDYPI